MGRCVLEVRRRKIQPSDVFNINTTGSAGSQNDEVEFFVRCCDTVNPGLRSSVDKYPRFSDMFCPVNFERRALCSIAVEVLGRFRLADAMFLSFTEAFQAITRF
jgi:hypothetical protein